MVRPARESRTRPAYAIASVDNALRLMAILQLEGRLTLSEAAHRIDVAPSTAHRVLAMLVYRDFAARDGAGYIAGPLLGDANGSFAELVPLRSVLIPALGELVERVGETATAVIRRGARTQFIAEVECELPYRVGARVGLTFPLYRTSGGLALLAQMSPGELDELLHSHGEDGDWPARGALEARLASVRAHGFALNRGLSEAGLVGMGCAVPMEPRIAISVAMPARRFHTVDVRRLEAALGAAAERVRREWVAAEDEPGEPGQ